MSSKLDTRELAAYLEDEVTASEARAIEAALAGDAEARKRLGELRALGDALSAPLPELERVELTSRVRKALAEPAPSPSGRRRPRTWMLGAAAALAAAFALVVGARPERSQDAEFRAKSAAIAPNGARWAGIEVHRVDATGASERVRERLSPRDGLVFSYTNLGPAPFEYLMIFAVDAQGRVYWFYPAYEQAGTDPAAVAIQKRTSETRLPDVVHHDFAPGTLSIHGLFARRALRVSRVEAWIGEHGARLESAPPLPETSLHGVEVRVEP